MDHTPPPFFKRGPAPLVRLFFFASLSLALLVIDARFRYVDGLRTWLALAAYPLQRAATWPIDLALSVGGYFSTQTNLIEENERLRAQALANVQDAQRYQALQAETAELRCMPANAEVQNGDRLVTSGIDGTYPAGLPVASVVRVERDAEHSFARVVCKPAAGIERGRYVLILTNEAARPPRPDETQAKERRGEKTRRAKTKEKAADDSQ